MAAVLFDLLICQHCKVKYLPLNLDGRLVYRHMRSSHNCLYRLQAYDRSDLESQIWRILHERFVLSSKQRQVITDLAAEHNQSIDRTSTAELLGSIVTLIQNQSDVDSARANSILRSMLKQIECDGATVVRLVGHEWCADLFE